MKIKIRRPVNKKIIHGKHALFDNIEQGDEFSIAKILGCHSYSVLKRLRKLRLAKKKSAFYKEQDPKQVKAYLEKIKGILKEKLVFIDETCISNSKAALIPSN